MQKPDATSEVPGLQRGADGKYTEAIGANRDPLKVFTVVEEDGRPAIRISGEVFGEIRSSQSLENYRLRLQFKWGKAKWPPRHKPNTPRDSGLLYHLHAERRVSISTRRAVFHVAMWPGLNLQVADSRR